MLNKIQSKTINDSIEKERVMDTKEANTITDLNQFKASESKTVNRNNNGEGIMSVVNAKTGKRITLSRQLMDKLNNPEIIVISFNHNKIAIAKQLPNNENYLSIKHYKSKGILYSAGIVNEITCKYNLDFSNKTSITFSDVEYITYEKDIVAIITVDNNN